MNYHLKAPILGFEHISEVRLEKIDTLFSRLISTNLKGNNTLLDMVLVNPYALREYSFTIPKYIELLLELDLKSKVEVYCVVVLQKNLEDSMVNFLAPLVFNPKNGFGAQVALSMMDYPDFGFRDTLKSFAGESRERA
ncbi:flagellar assembly protein FliW [Helicobacter cetorum]|uniref:Flagellar assembly factor FliW n=1 Tax=Helicobacter cetorum (strain ATCC BAA-429 / MIT 00-7128) TaxID=182217 RepID=I0ELT2_HELC0|nr:flagellar assembly protein FliW [Helicobacter cetorum]AFI03901.1 flagellar assembly protein FliW [Helicobacter cetorum MIT 00-7128]